MVNKTFIEVIEQLITVNQQLLDDEIDINKAKAFAQNVQIIINGAKVYVDAIKLKGSSDVSFFSENQLQLPEKTLAEKILSGSNNAVVIEPEELNIGVKKKDKVKKVKEAKNICITCGKPAKTGSDLCDECLKTKYKVEKMLKKTVEAIPEQKEELTDADKFINKFRESEIKEVNIGKSSAVEVSCDYCKDHAFCIEHGWKNTDVTRDCPYFKFDKEMYDELNN